MLLHHCLSGQVIRNNCLHDRVMTIDVKMGHRIILIIALHLPNTWTYDLKYFQEIFEDIERLAMEATDRKYELIIERNFNLSLERRDRCKIMQEFGNQVSMEIANWNIPAEEAVSWTFESSIHGLHRLNYMLHSLVFRSCDVSFIEMNRTH